MASASTIRFPVTTPRKDPHKKMLSVQWYGKKDVRLVESHKPMITEPRDVLVRVTLASICGSDLHLYHNEFSGMERGDILGHECMGIVEEVGNEVKEIKVGDKVVVSAIIAEGNCFYCQKELYSCCDFTNPSTEMEKQYGHRTAGLFGYSHLTGGYDGGQAEYIRVPIGDLNCLKVDPDMEDEKALFLSDVLATGWHACELGEVKEGQNVAVWGAGPVGLMAMMWAKYRGAKSVFAIDVIPARLEMAKKKLGVEIIHVGERDVVKTLQDLCPGGPDVCIDAAGFRFPKSLIHRIQRAVRIETDAPEVLREAILTVRKGGVVAVVGDYYSHTNGYPIGAFMEKGLTMRAGQVHVQKYWKQLLEIVKKGEVDPTFIITHRFKLEEAVQAYKIFDHKEDDCIKVVLKP